MSSPDGSTVIFRRIPAGVRPLALRRFARRLQREVCGGRRFDCLVAGDGELRRLNREFRGKDYATDVLSFPTARSLTVAAPGETNRVTPTRSRDREGAGPPANCATDRVGRRKRLPHASGLAGLGDIAISFQRARAQARAYGHQPEIEIRILMLHGVLHLLGMDHENEPAGPKGRMARAEALWRARLGLPVGLIERAAL